MPINESEIIWDKPDEESIVWDDAMGAMPFVNRAIAETYGAPGDMVRGGVERLIGRKLPQEVVRMYPFALGGQKGIESGMKSIGVKLPEEGRQPATIPEHMGAVTGQATALMFPAGATVKGLSKGVNLTGKVASTIWESMIKHPYLTMVSETTGGMGAGAGRGIAEHGDMGPGGTTAMEVVGGLTGGMTPTVLAHAPTQLLYRSGKNILYKLVAPFTKKGGMYRAGENVKGLVADPTQTQKQLAEKTISDLPPAVAAGEKRIVELYKHLVGQDPLTDKKAIESLTKSITKLEGEMRKLGYGSPELLAEITQKRIAALELSMDRRAMDALTVAQKRLDRLPKARRKAIESRIVRNQLEGARREAHAETQKLWKQVNKDIEVGFENTRKTYFATRDDLGKAQQVDIPSALKASKITKKKLKIKSTNIREMQSLRSKLLETSRMARKNGEWNKSRIAEDVADAILEDIGIVAGNAETGAANDLQAALAATKHYKTRFESGETGRLLGFSKSGAPAIDPDLALKMTIGRMGERGGIDINKIVVSPEAQAATERYLGRSFVEFAAPNRNPINPVKAERWLRNNEAILDNFPNLKSQIKDASKAQEFADQTRMRMDVRKSALRNKNISKSEEFLNRTNMGREVEGIFKSDNPSRLASEMVKQARKDVSGDAIAGVRAGFVDHILEKSRYGSFDELGRKSISGRAILNFIRQNEPTLKTVFDPQQIGRMKRIGTELAKIEAFEKIKPGQDIELTDWASTALQHFSALIGARVGGKLGAQSMGGSLQYASRFSGLAQKFVNWLSKDTAKQLINDAITSKDPKLLQALLKPIGKPNAKKSDVVFLNKQLNLWLLSSGKRVMDDIEKQEE